MNSLLHLLTSGDFWFRYRMASVDHFSSCHLHPLLMWYPLISGLIHQGLYIYMDCLVRYHLTENSAELAMYNQSTLVKSINSQIVGFYYHLFYLLFCLGQQILVTKYHSRNPSTLATLKLYILTSLFINIFLGMV